MGRWRAVGLIAAAAAPGGCGSTRTVTTTTSTAPNAQTTTSRAHTRTARSAATAASAAPATNTANTTPLGGIPPSSRPSPNPAGTALLNQCIPKPASDTDASHNGCPAGQYTREQAVNDDGCVGIPDARGVYWPPACDEKPIDAHGLPCEFILSTGQVIPSTPARSQSTPAGTHWIETPACLPKQ